MAQKEKIQYVRYYAVGTEAHKLERQPERKKEPKPIAPPIPVQRITVSFDPVAVVGTVVALAMLVCMLVGFWQVNEARNQVLQMEGQLSALKAENAQLQIEYDNGYDLDQVRIAAGSIGLVPREEVRHITVTVPEPVVEEEPTWWEEIVSDLQELFA